MPTAKIPSFFKTAKPRRFDFKPRYYDPARDAAERRRAGHTPGNSAGDRIRASFRNNRKSSQAVRRAANFRLALIVMALMVLGYLVFF